MDICLNWYLNIQIYYGDWYLTFKIGVLQYKLVSYYRDAYPKFKISGFFMGQTRPLFVYFRSFHNTMTIIAQI